MQMYFSKSKGGFCPDDVYGTKTIMVNDPNWVRPTIEVPDPNWVAPADDPTATAPLIAVPDRSAVCPQIEVANPNCILPADAVPVTMDTFNSIHAAIKNGQVLSADANGNPITVAPTITLAEAQAAQIVAIYADYQKAIAQPVAYTSKAGVAQTFQADPTSTGYVNSMLSAYGAAQATPAGFYWVAADNSQVAFSYADLQGLAAVMGAQGWAAFQKLQGYKAQINAAQTVADVQAVVWS